MLNNYSLYIFKKKYFFFNICPLPRARNCLCAKMNECHGQKVMSLMLHQVNMKNDHDAQYIININNNHTSSHKVQHFSGSSEQAKGWYAIIKWNNVVFLRHH